MRKSQDNWNAGSFSAVCYHGSCCSKHKKPASAGCVSVIFRGEEKEGRNQGRRKTPKSMHRDRLWRFLPCGFHSCNQMDMTPGRGETAASSLVLATTFQINNFNRPARVCCAGQRTQERTSKVLSPVLHCLVYLFFQRSTIVLEKKVFDYSTSL